MAASTQGDRSRNLDKLQLLEGKIGVDSIAGLCQALGYFPSGEPAALVHTSHFIGRRPVNVLNEEPVVQ